VKGSADTKTVHLALGKCHEGGPQDEAQQIWHRAGRPAALVHASRTGSKKAGGERFG
jgi:hypothetical protein